MPVQFYRKVFSCYTNFMSEEELKSLLRRNIELSEENNQLLHSIKRMTFWGGVLKYVWWAFIFLGLPLLAYYWYLAPYVQQALGTYREFQNGVHQAQGIGANIQANNPFVDLKKLYDKYQAGHASTTSN